MDDLGSHELRPLDVMNKSRLWMILTILHHELKVVDDIMTLGHELMALDTMSSSGLWLT